MKIKDLTARVREMAEPVCKEVGVSLWDVTFEKEGSSYVLTVYIDRDEGVFIEDCEKVSRAIDPQLDEPEFDSLPSYTLTVSSAGLERKLVRPEHFEWAKGKTVSVSLYKGGTVVGTLLEKNDAEIVLLCGEEEKKIPLSESGGTKLYFE